MVVEYIYRRTKMKRNWLCLCAALFALMTSSCTMGRTSFTVDTYPRVDGSTATIPLSQDIAKALLKLSQEEAARWIKHNTTHTAYMNLVEGKADLILVTEPSEEELKLARDKNIELEVIPVVKDAFVFLINDKNPVESLTVEQIQKIYGGSIKNWKEVGGENKEILAYQRPKNSGSQTLMENLVMKGMKIREAPKEMMPSEMGTLIERVSGYENSDRALGYSVYYYANAMYRKENVKLLGVNGIKPGTQTIKEGKYPFTSAYYAVLKKSELEKSSARELLRWILSKQGQDVAEKSGYVPIK